MKIRWVKLGIVGKGHGLNGTFFISGRDAAIPGGVKTLRIGKNLQRAQDLTVQTSRMQGDRPTVHCKEVQSRNDVDILKGQTIWCRRDEITVEEEREYLWSDIEGLLVIDSDDRLVGKIVAVQNYGASDIVEIENQQLGRLALPFVDAYFDMNFRSDAEQIRLLVPLTTFDEAWET
ncbi:MAG: ribosome maturation factor RimM [Oligoflexus sp.]